MGCWGEHFPTAGACGKSMAMVTAIWMESFDVIMLGNREVTKTATLLRPVDKTSNNINSVVQQALHLKDCFRMK